MFYDMINSLAERTFGSVPTLDNLNEWADHWFKCADDIRDSFYNQGLAKSGDHIQSIIDQQRQFYPRV
jgi:hypothetical protein